MQLLTWNINGIRASKIPVPQLLEFLQADIICFQETKITRDMLDEMTAVVEGYSAYFSFSRKRSGYSGVVTYCKDCCLPTKAEEGLSAVLNKKDADDVVGYYGNVSDFSKEELDSIDAEGRAVITQHDIRTSDGSCKSLALINVYCPRYDSENEDRHHFKLRFFALLQIRAEALIQSGSHVIILGDINTSHQDIDYCESNTSRGAHTMPSRLWLNQMLHSKQQIDGFSKNTNLADMGTQPEHVEGGLFIDTFRYLHPDQLEAYTNWCSHTGARQTNFGRRLDYILCDEQLQDAITSCSIMTDVDGSDHCPVKASFNFIVVTALKAPSHCSKFMPEFAGKQQKLSMFFTKSHTKPSENVSDKSNIAKQSTVIESKEKQKVSSQSLKRQGSQNLVLHTKKIKSCTENKPKQINLMGFFNKKSLSSGKLEQDSLEQKTVQNSIKTILDDSKFNSSSGSQEKTTAPCVLSDLETSRDVEDSSLGRSKVKSTAQGTPNSQALAWKTLLKGPPPAPLCSGHNEACILRTVKKAGPTQGRQFFTCARPDGASNNLEARCNFFKWVKDLKK
ncbi:DNA-(apurinic or apyrimidinic site) lyase 2-like [Argonauta hians]